jgi:hypothetical protein
MALHGVARQQDSAAIWWRLERLMAAARRAGYVVL